MPKAKTAPKPRTKPKYNHPQGPDDPLILSDRDWKIVIDAIENPRPAGPKLREAMRKHLAIVGGRKID